MSDEVPRFSISILTYCAVRQAKACIAAIYKSKVPFKLYLTANGNKEVAAFFREIAVEKPWVTVIENEKNLGYIEPNKRFFELCDTEYAVLCNDDCFPPPDFLEQLEAPFKIYPTAALSAPKGGCQSLRPDFNGFRGPGFEYLNGAFLCCKTSIIKRHGFCDRHLTFAYCDDADLSLRMRELGYTLHYADFVLHHEMNSTSKYVPEIKVHLPGNHAYCIKRWGHYLKVRTFGYPIIVRRAAANGDVLLTTPILRALHERSPLSPLFIDTVCPQVYANHPYVKTMPRGATLKDACSYELNGTYELTPDRHIIDSYAAKIGFEPGEYDYRTELFISDAEKTRAERTMPGEDWIALHIGPNTWKSKEWPHDRWKALAAGLRAGGNKLVIVGAGGMQIDNDLDLRSRTTVTEMGAHIQRAKLFIGLDSLPLHVAEAVGTKAIGLFGVTDPKFIITRPERTISVCGTAPSFGLRHRVKGQTSVDDGGAAMNSITIEMVMEAVNAILHEHAK